MLLTVLSSEGHENFLEAVPIIAEIPLVLPSSGECGKLGTTGTTVWFMVEYCQNYLLPEFKEARLLFTVEGKTDVQAAALLRNIWDFNNNKAIETWDQ